MATSIELSEETCIDLLKRYIDIGYTKTGSLSIKDGGVLHRYFRVLKKQEKDDSLDQEKIYKVVFRSLELFNTQKGYTLDDAAVIDKVITYIQEEVFSKTEKIREF